MKGPSSRRARASGRTASSDARSTSKSTRTSSAPSSGRTRASARRRTCATRFSDATATSAATRRSSAAPSSATNQSSPTTPDCNAGADRHMQLNPDIFKAYDVRGVFPGEINEEAARAIGAAFIAYLKVKKIAVGRDMRLSSPALAAAFIDGATSQGADVVNFGMIATDMLYFAVAKDGLDGGVQVTASHNPKQYN